jgi:ankyrin repeat protein
MPTRRNATAVLIAIGLLAPAPAGALAGSQEGAVTSAAAQGQLAELQKLVEGQKPSPSLLSDALVGAARGGHGNVVAYLLAQGADVGRASAAFGTTPLAAAVRYGHTALAEELVRRGAKPATAEQLAALGLDRELAAALDADPKLLQDVTRDEVRQPVLHAAARHGRVATVELLLQRGAAVDLADAQGLTPLHVAAMHGREMVVRHLLDKKADVHARTPVVFMAGLHAGRHTPLHLAVGTNQPRVVALLCDAGAGLDDQSFPFDRMLNHALYRGQGPLVEVLVAKRGKGQWQALLDRAVSGQDLLHHPELVLEALVRLGVDVPKALPEPAIVWAMARGYRQLALQFIDGGADPRAGLALARAAERGYDEIVARLLEKQVDVDDGGGAKTTPLQFAVYDGHVKCVELLLKHGADSKRVGAAARAALEASADPNHRRILELLRRHEAAK